MASHRLACLLAGNSVTVMQAVDQRSGMTRPNRRGSCDLDEDRGWTQDSAEFLDPLAQASPLEILRNEVAALLQIPDAKRDGADR